MANLGLFNAADVPPQEDFGPVPAGEYPAQIIDSEMRATASNAGQYLSLTHQIIDGPFKGRLVWARLNLDNPNAQTVEIANRQLSAICHAVGILKVTDSLQLHNRPLMIRVEFVPAGTDRRGRTRDRDSNEIKGWKKLEGEAPAAASASAQAAMPGVPAPAIPRTAAPAAASAPPWKRNAA